MSIDELIKEKIRFIQEKTKNKVNIIPTENTFNTNAILDWDNWTDKTKLPEIKHKQKINEIHIFHELLHVENFFIDNYYLVGHNNKITNISSIDKEFKQIPEDFVVHKKIYHDYKLDPIDPCFNADAFLNPRSISMNERDIAAKLTLLYTYIEFRPYLKKYFDKMYGVVRARASLCNKVKQAIEVLKKTDVYDRESHKKTVQRLIEIFAEDYLKRHQIYSAFIRKVNSKWQFFNE